MKLKHRALTLLLTVAMLLTFMPAMAFAEPDKSLSKADAVSGEEEGSETGWYVINYGGDYYLGEAGEVTLTVETDYEGTSTPSYQWSTGGWNETDEWAGTEIAGANNTSYLAAEPGIYRCDVTIDGYTDWGFYYVYEGEDEDSGEGSVDWYVTNSSEEYDLVEGGVTLTVETNYEGTSTPSYQWSKGEWDEDDDWKGDDIEGATYASYLATEPGIYRCVVTIGEDKDWGYYYVNETYDWTILYDDEVIFRYGESAVLKVGTNYSGAQNDITYKWAEYVKDPEDGDYKWKEIPNETGDTLAVSESGKYKCEVTINGQTQKAIIYAEYDTHDYGWTVTYPGATATYTSVDPEGPKITYANDIYSYNLAAKGDKITIKKNAADPGTVFICDDNEIFVSEDGEEVYLYWDEDWDVDVKNNKVKVNIYSDEEYDHAKKTVVVKYDITTSLDAAVTSDIMSMRFEPSSISLYSEDVKIVENGWTGYSIQNRGKYKDEDGETFNTCFLNGDKVIIRTASGEKTYKYLPNTSHAFVNTADSEDYIYIYIAPNKENLNPGNNKVTFWHHGFGSTINVFLDTPAMRAARASEARAKARDAASNINKSTVSASDIKKASDLGATSVTLGAGVKKIQKNAFKGTNITYVELKTKKLKAKSVKGSLKGSKVKTIKVNIGKKKVNKQYVKKYKKIFTKKNAGKKAKVK